MVPRGEAFFGMPSWQDRAPPRRAPHKGSAALVDRYMAQAGKLNREADELERRVGASLTLLRKKLGRVEKGLRQASERPQRRRVAH